MDETRVIHTASCSPKEPISPERNYCRDCGYPIVWDRQYGWVAGRIPDPELGTIPAPPDGDGHGG